VFEVVPSKNKGTTHPHTLSLPSGFYLTSRRHCIITIISVYDYVYYLIIYGHCKHLWTIVPCLPYTPSFTDVAHCSGFHPIQALVSETFLSCRHPCYSETRSPSSSSWTDTTDRQDALGNPASKSGTSRPLLLPEGARPPPPSRAGAVVGDRTRRASVSRAAAPGTDRSPFRG
jgi:hypothetical protein